jgi:hypothetical protein
MAMEIGPSEIGIDPLLETQSIATPFTKAWTARDERVSRPGQIATANWGVSKRLDG